MRANSNRKSRTTRVSSAAAQAMEQLESRTFFSGTIAAWNFNNLVTKLVNLSPVPSTGTGTANSIGMTTNATPTVVVGTQTSGTYTLTVTDSSGTYQTSALAYNASAATIQTALRALSATNSSSFTATSYNATNSAFTLSIASDPTGVLTASGASLSTPANFSVSSYATTGASGPDLSAGDNTTGSSDGTTGFDWKIVGSNGWNTSTGIGTQGAQFVVPTTGYGNISLNFDWGVSSTSANGQLAVEYTLNSNSATPTWTVAPASSLSIPSGDTNTEISTNSTNPNIINGSYFQNIGSGTWQDGLSVSLSSITGANNNPNFGVRIVNAATGAAVVNGALPIAIASASESGSTVTINTSTGTYNAGQSATIAGLPTGYNGNFIITAVGTNSFSYTDPTSGLTATTAAGGTVNPGPSQTSANWRLDEVQIVGGNSSPVITQNPVSTSVSSGNSATFTAAALGYPTPTVQWMVNSGSGFVAAPGASTGNSYTFTTNSSESGYQYEAVYTVAGGTSVTTTPATLTVTNGLAVITQPTSIVVNAGSSASFTAAANGSSSINVQWLVETPGSTIFSPITGATSNTYTFYPTESQTGDQFEAQFSAAGYASVTSNLATLTVTGTPITVWSLPTQATSPVVAPQPAPTIGTGSAIPLGMQNQYNLGVQSYPEDDITSTTGTADTSFTENLWRIRGGSGAGATGSPGSPEGWSSEAPEYTQGAEFDVSTVGYTDITVHADWYTTGSGVKDLQPQYNTNINGSSGWVNFGSPLVAGAGDYYTTGGASVTPTGINLNFQGNTAVENDPNLGIRFVAAYDTADLPSIDDGNQLITGGVGTHGQYATATPGGAFTSQEIAINIGTSGGTFTLTLGANTTGPISYDNGYSSTTGLSNLATNIQAALAALPGLSGSKAVTVVSQDNIASNYIVTFSAAQTGAMTLNAANLTGTSPGGSVIYAGAVVPYTEAGSGNWRFGNIGFYGDAATGTPGIITEPVSVTATLPGGGSAGAPTQAFTAAAYSTTADTVQWEVSTNGGSTFSPISNGTAANGIVYSGATNAVFANTTTTSTLTVTASSVSQSGLIYEAIFTGAGSATTNPATLSVVVPITPTIITQPASVSAIVGNNASFTATAQGLPASTVVWQVSTDGGQTWNTATGTVTPATNTQVAGYIDTTSSITFATTSTENGYEYRAAFTNSIGTAYTTASVAGSTGVLTVLPIEPAITQWNFGTDPSTIVAAPDNTPTPTINTASGALTTLGMNDGNFALANGGYPSVAADDTTSTAGTLDTTYVENLLRIRGGTAANTPGGTANGWDALAPQYSQGLEIDVNTTGYQNLYLTFDWYTTAQGVRDLQEQYNLNTGNSSSWTNVNALLVAANGGDYYGSVSGGAPTGALLDLTAIAGSANDANFGIRLVSAYDPALPLITDSQTVQQNDPVLPGVEPHGQYASSTLVNGAPTPLNGSSGNWRFGNINIYGVVSSTTPAWLASNSIATWNASNHTLVVSGASTIIGDPGTDEPNITFSATGATLTINTGTTRTVNIGSLAISGGNNVVMTSGTTTHTLIDAGALTTSTGNTLDIGNNFLDLQTASLATTMSEITSNTLFSSDTTAGTLGAIGAIVNGTDFSASNAFDVTVTPGSTDVLVRYTYLGDANLDGVVDGSDYTKIDHGFSTGATGWANGDFNYDNQVDGSDYTLIDNAFNTQGAHLTPTAQIASQFAAAIPSSGVFNSSTTISWSDWQKKNQSNGSGGLLDTPNRSN